MSHFRKTSLTYREKYDGKHRFEHWYRDNQVYFITARCRAGTAAFALPKAQEIVWTKFDQYTAEFDFEPWVTSLMTNHYHTLGYLRKKENLGPMMQRLHGSVAKLVNDTNEEDGMERLTPFWGDTKHNDYMDGCIRDELQADRAYRYVLMQAVKARVVKEWREYPNTRVQRERGEAIGWAREHAAFMYGVEYPRYRKVKGARKSQQQSR
ncbi:MAG TPA: hypothetical protein VK986_06960 [Tepidisphaeraceae bacterium]|nr:hypothetical protein [Tepidisphaeraceae bacterium]